MELLDPRVVSGTPSGGFLCLVHDIGSILLVVIELIESILGPGPDFMTRNAIVTPFELVFAEFGLCFQGLLLLSELLHKLLGRFCCLSSAWKRRHCGGSFTRKSRMTEETGDGIKVKWQDKRERKKEGKGTLQCARF